MNQALIRLTERKRLLIEQAAIQRATVAQEIEPWRPVVARADQGLALGRYLKSHPLLLVGGAALVAAVGRGRLVRWLGRGMFAWRMISNLRII
jgi:phage antirepressor YoqD-like protein